MPEVSANPPFVTVIDMATSQKLYWMGVMVGETLTFVLGSWIFLLRVEKDGIITNKQGSFKLYWKDFIEFVTKPAPPHL